MKPLSKNIQLKCFYGADSSQKINKALKFAEKFETEEKSEFVFRSSENRGAAEKQGVMGGMGVMGGGGGVLSYLHDTELMMFSPLFSVGLLPDDGDCCSKSLMLLLSLLCVKCVKH